MADALYAVSDFFKFLLGHKKDVIAVLKNEQRDLWQHATQFFAQEKPVVEYTDNETKIKVWDGGPMQKLSLS